MRDGARGAAGEAPSFGVDAVRRIFGRLRPSRQEPALARSEAPGLWVNAKLASVPADPTDLIAFFHAQRTGGSALRHLFGDALGRERVYCTQFTEEFQHWGDLDPDALAGKAVFAGHSNFTPRELGRTLRPITLVRHPFFRTVSLYFYCRRYPNQFLHHLTEGRDVRAFYEVASARKPVYFHNVMCRRIAAEPSCDAALARLRERFLAVGTTERLGEFVDWLFARYGLTVPTVPTQPADAERYADHAADSDFVAEVMAANAEDARLFATLNDAGFGLPAETEPAAS